MADVLGDEQWATFERLGYLCLGRILGDTALAELRGGVDGALPAELVADPRVQELIRRPLFRDLAARFYGPHAGVSIHPALVTSDPTGQDGVPSWHQVGGDAWGLDRDPLVALWVALDPARRGSGRLQVVPGTHRLGLLGRSGRALAPESTRLHCPEEGITSLDLSAGEAVLLHNWLVRRREDDPTGTPGRALHVCYMDARTRSTLTGDLFPTLFDPRPGSAGPWPFVERLRGELQHFRDTAREAERYALSLADYVKVLERARSASESQARSLEAELLRARALATPPRTGVSRLPGVIDEG